MEKSQINNKRRKTLFWLKNFCGFHSTLAGPTDVGLMRLMLMYAYWDNEAPSKYFLTTRNKMITIVSLVTWWKLAQLTSESNKLVQSGFTITFVSSIMFQFYLKSHLYFFPLQCVVFSQSSQMYHNLTFQKYFQTRAIFLKKNWVTMWYLFHYPLELHQNTSTRTLAIWRKIKS